MGEHGPGGGRGPLQQDLMEAQAALDAASQGGDARRLRAALTVARMSGVAPAMLRAAGQRLQELEEAARRSDDAEEALLVACEDLAAGSGSIQALAHAIGHAVECGSDTEMIEEARATLRSRQAMLGYSRAGAGGEPLSADLAEQVLAAVATGDDVRALEEAIEEARKAGVNEATLREADSALEVVQELAEARASAEESLFSAVGSGHTMLLQAAIALAEEAGVAVATVDEARAKLRLFEAVA